VDRGEGRGDINVQAGSSAGNFPGGKGGRRESSRFSESRHTRGVIKRKTDSKYENWVGEKERPEAGYYSYHWDDLTSPWKW